MIAPKPLNTWILAALMVGSSWLTVPSYVMAEPGSPQAGPAGEVPPPPGPPPEDRIMTQLNLTDEQKAKVKAVIQGQRQYRREEIKASMEKRRQLMEMLKSGSGSKEEALALHNQLAQEQSALMAARISMVYDLKAILTPEQFAQYTKLMQERRANHRKAGGPHQGPAPNSKP